MNHIRQFSNHSYRAYKKDLEHWLQFLQSQGANLYRISLPLCRSYVAAMKQRGLALNTINRHISSLKSFYRYLDREQSLESSPWNLIRLLKKRQPLPQYLNLSEIEKLATACGNDYRGALSRTILELGFSTGARISELCALDCKDCFEGNGRVRKHLLITGKGNKTRYVFLGPASRISLKDYIQKRDAYWKSLKTAAPETPLQKQSPGALFLNTKGRRLGTRSCYQLIRELGQKAGLQRPLHPHLLRHSFATALMNHGAEIRSIQALLGHKSLSSTQIYTHTTIRNLQKVYRKAHPHGKK